LPAVLNVYKLDLYYIQRLIHRIAWWAVNTRVTTILPFLWLDITDVSLRLPWRHKVTRRLVTSVVERLEPRLANDPTDRGAPFRPLRLGTAARYAHYLAKYVFDIAGRHYLLREPRLLSSSRSVAISRDWADLLTTRATHLLHDGRELIRRVGSTGGESLGSAGRREFLTMLQVQLLFDCYPGIRRELAFS
jgi:hypothetical protein